MIDDDPFVGGAPIVDDTDPHETAGTDPHETAGTDPYETAGTDPHETAGTDPYETAGTDPYETAGTDPYETAGTDPYETAGTDPYETAGTDPHETAGTDPHETAGPVEVDLGNGESIGVALDAENDAVDVSMHLDVSAFDVFGDDVLFPSALPAQDDTVLYGPGASGAPSELFTLETRAESMTVFSAGGAVRHGELDMVQIGNAESADIVSGEEKATISGELREHTGGNLHHIAREVETTVGGRMSITAGFEDSIMLGGTMTDTWTGPALIMAAMSDDLCAGGGARVTTALDLWLNQLTGMEERPGTAAADGVFVEGYGTLFEREYGPSAYAVGSGVWSGTTYVTTKSGFRPLMRVATGVRNLIPGAGAAASEPAPPPSGAEAGMAGGTLVMGGAGVASAGVNAGQAVDSTVDMARAAETSADAASMQNAADLRHTGDTASQVEDLRTGVVAQFEVSSLTVRHIEFEFSPHYASTGGDIDPYAVSRAGDDPHANQVPPLGQASPQQVDHIQFVPSPNHASAGGDIDPQNASRLADGPHSVADNPYSVADDPYSVADDPYSVADDPHSVADNPYSVADNPYSVADDPYSVADDPYSLADDPYSLPDANVPLSPNSAPPPLGPRPAPPPLGPRPALSPLDSAVERQKEILTKSWKFEANMMLPSGDVQTQISQISDGGRAMEAKMDAASRLQIAAQMVGEGKDPRLVLRNAADFLEGKGFADEAAKLREAAAEYDVFLDSMRKLTPDGELPPGVLDYGQEITTPPDWHNPKRPLPTTPHDLLGLDILSGGRSSGIYEEVGGAVNPNVADPYARPVNDVDPYARPGDAIYGVLENPAEVLPTPGADSPGQSGLPVGHPVGLADALLDFTPTTGRAGGAGTPTTDALDLARTPYSQLDVPSFRFRDPDVDDVRHLVAIDPEQAVGTADDLAGAAARRAEAGADGSVPVNVRPGPDPNIEPQWFDPYDVTPAYTPPAASDGTINPALADADPNPGPALSDGPVNPALADADPNPGPALSDGPANPALTDADPSPGPALSGEPVNPVPMDPDLRAKLAEDVDEAKYFLTRRWKSKMYEYGDYIQNPAYDPDLTDGATEGQRDAWSRLHTAVEYVDDGKDPRKMLREAADSLEKAGYADEAATLRAAAADFDEFLDKMRRLTPDGSLPPGVLDSGTVHADSPILGYDSVTGPDSPAFRFPEPDYDEVGVAGTGVVAEPWKPELPPPRGSAPRPQIDEGGARWDVGIRSPDPDTGEYRPVGDYQDISGSPPPKPPRRRGGDAGTTQAVLPDTAGSPPPKPPRRRGEDAGTTQAVPPDTRAVVEAVPDTSVGPDGTVRNLADAQDEATAQSDWRYWFSQVDESGASSTADWEDMNAQMDKAYMSARRGCEWRSVIAYGDALNQMYTDLTRALVDVAGYGEDAANAMPNSQAAYAALVAAVDEAGNAGDWERVKRITQFLDGFDVRTQDTLNDLASRSDELSRTSDTSNPLLFQSDYHVDHQTLQGLNLDHHIDRQKLLDELTRRKEAAWLDLQQASDSSDADAMIRANREMDYYEQMRFTLEQGRNPLVESSEQIAYLRSTGRSEQADQFTQYQGELESLLSDPDYHKSADQLGAHTYAPASAVRPDLSGRSDPVHAITYVPGAIDDIDMQSFLRAEVDESGGAAVHGEAGVTASAGTYDAGRDMVNGQVGSADFVRAPAEEPTWVTYKDVSDADMDRNIVEAERVGEHLTAGRVPGVTGDTGSLMQQKVQEGFRGRTFKTSGDRKIFVQATQLEVANEAWKSMPTRVDRGLESPTRRAGKGVRFGDASGIVFDVGGTIDDMDLSRPFKHMESRAVNWPRAGYVPTRQPGFGRTVSAAGDFPFSVREQLVNALMQGQRLDPESMASLKSNFVWARKEHYSSAASKSDWLKMAMTLRDLEMTHLPRANRAPSTAVLLGPEYARSIDGKALDKLLALFEWSSVRAS